jgi:hypothetical protein
MPRVRSLFSFKDGDHTCVFYADQRSLLDVLTPYIAEGLRKNERCFCAQKPETLRALAFDLQFLGIDIDQEVKRGRLDLHTTNEVYFHSNRFEPEILLDMLLRSVDESARQGFRAFRTAGELSWALEGRGDCDRLIGYEQAVQAAYPGKRVLGICQYPLRDMPPLVLDRIVAAHSHVLNAAGTRNASLCITAPRCEAEIVTDRLTVHPAYQYVVQLHNGEHLWGNSQDFSDALRAVEDLIAAHSA